VLKRQVLCGNDSHQSCGCGDNLMRLSLHHAQIQPLAGHTARLKSETSFASPVQTMELPVVRPTKVTYANYELRSKRPCTPISVIKSLNCTLFRML
jgi:hypothetical protein